MQTLTLYADGCLTILLKGELDHCAAQDAMQSIEELVEEYLPRRCVLDLSGLTFMDSSGIAVILKADRLLRQSGASRAQGAGGGGTHAGDPAVRRNGRGV